MNTVQSLFPSKIPHGLQETDPQGYTKHYYAETERITSQLGRGQFADVGTPVVSDSLVQVKLQAVTGNVEYPSTLTVPSSGTFAYLDTLTNQQNATSTLYFYHPDHLGSSSWITTTNGTVKQHLHYLPWGEDFVNQRSSHFDGVRYTFSAKERDSETGYSYFGSRYYSSDLSIWLSVDPQASKYPSLSPYVYCANNPVKLVDPNGEEINPIYDLNGNFLGTDDNGLQGKALFMKRSDFRQNMSSETARKLDQGISSLKNEAAKEKFNEHYQGLKSRPDYDGYITFDEANEWYRNGNGEPLFADLRKIDLSGFRSLGESKVGKEYSFNLIYNSGSKDDRLVYGSLTFIRTSNDGVRAYADWYDFDMKPWLGNTVRNIQTLIGRQVAGEGKPYLVYLYGTATLKSSIFAH